MTRAEAGLRGMSKPFTFSLGTPLLKGNLLKQGGFGKLFKKRYFVLYPGFLVYYNDVVAWKTDVARGDTLGNRIGAVYLKGATCKIADHTPKGCRFGFSIQAPDPRNKRQSFLLNASDKAERDAWTEAIIQATPQKKVKEMAVLPPPTINIQTVRCDAVDMAAVVGVGESHNEDEERVTNMDASILPTAEEMSSFHGSEEASNVDQLADHFLRPQNNVMDNDSDRESPAPEDMLCSEEQAVMVFGDNADDDEPEITIPEVVLNVCEQSVEPLKINSSPSESSKVSWCTAEGCSVVEDKTVTYSINDKTVIEGCNAIEDNMVTYSINVANMSVGNGSGSQNSDTSDSCEEDDVPKTTERDSKKGKVGSRGSKEIEANEDSKASGTLENRRGNEQAGTSVESPTKHSGTFIQKKGFIYKLGGKRKSWKLRYVVLNPGYFCYYKDPSVPKPIGEVKLKNVTVMESDHTSKGKQPFQFVVHTESTWNNRCDWILAAVKAEELQDWITAFQLAGQRR